VPGFVRKHWVALVYPSWGDNSRTIRNGSGNGLARPAQIPAFVWFVIRLVVSKPAVLAFVLFMNKRGENKQKQQANQAVDPRTEKNTEEKEKRKNAGKKKKKKKKQKKKKKTTWLRSTSPGLCSSPVSILAWFPNRSRRTLSKTVTTTDSFGYFVVWTPLPMQNKCRLAGGMNSRQWTPTAGRALARLRPCEFSQAALKGRPQEGRVTRRPLPSGLTGGRRCSSGSGTGGRAWMSPRGVQAVFRSRPSAAGVLGGPRQPTVALGRRGN